MASKYHARAVVVDGLKFDSQSEARRYEELRQLLLAREIRDLAVHPRFALYVPVFDDGEFAIDQERAAKGLYPEAMPVLSGLQRIGHYTADFSYTLPGTAGTVVEDVKAEKVSRRTGRVSHPTVTEAYRIRKRIVEASYGLTVVEVFR